MMYHFVKNHPTTTQKMVEAAVAAEFVTQLVKVLDFAELELSVLKNSLPSRPYGVCFLADYTDPNQCMLNAIGTVLPDCCEPDDEPDLTGDSFLSEIADNAYRLASAMLHNAYLD